MKRNVVLKKIFDHKIYIFITIILISVEAFLVSFSTILIAPIVDFFTNIQNDNFSKITNLFYELGIPQSAKFIILLFFLVFTFSYIFKIITFYYTLKFKYKFLIDLNKSFYKSVINSNWNYIKNQKSGNLINLIRLEIEKIGNIFMAISKFTSDLIQITFLIISALLVNLKITLSTFLFVSVFLIPFFLLKKISQKYGEISLSTGNLLSENLNNLTENIKIIITNNLGLNFLKKYLSDYYTHSKSAIISQTIIGGIPQIIYPIAVLILLSMILLSKNPNTSMAEMTVVFFIFYRVIPLLSSIVSSFNSIANVTPSLNELDRIYNDCLNNATKNNGIIFKNLNNCIEIRNVFFKHKDEKNYFFSNINLVIKKNQIFGIIGKSGSGKSTLTDIITGNLNIDKGSVFYDNINLQLFNHLDFRNKVSVIGQDVPIFNDTILNNLFIFEQNLKDDKVAKILTLTGVNDFVSKFELEYNTYVGTGGVLLSGGQKQRLALARALIRGPKILVLDEFTSSLDQKTEKAFLEIVFSLKKSMTIIIITHNMNNKNYFDNFIEIENGKLHKY